MLERLQEHKTPVKFLLLDFQGVGFIDITGVDELRILQGEIRQREIELALMGIHLPVMEVLESSGMINEMKTGHLIEKRGDAIAFLFHHIDHEYCKNVCPYMLFYECSSVKNGERTR
jgi:SulP family sulfate permease